MSLHRSDLPSIGTLNLYSLLNELDDVAVFDHTDFGIQAALESQGEREVARRPFVIRRRSRYWD
jgi:hypothetical protein